jgi:hypothetical protein
VRLHEGQTWRLNGVWLRIGFISLWGRRVDWTEGGVWRNGRLEVQSLPPEWLENRLISEGWTLHQENAA